jgi:hypothetical protein
VSVNGLSKAVKTMPLMTFEEGLQALRKATKAEYAPPRSESPTLAFTEEMPEARPAFLSPFFSKENVMTTLLEPDQPPRAV